MTERVETPRMIFRPLRAGDEALYRRLYEDPASMRFVGAPLSPESARRRFEVQLQASSGRAGMQRCLVMDERASGRAIGLCGLQPVDAGNRRVEAGMMLDASFQGRGFAKEGLAALVDHAFRIFPIDEVWVQYPPGHDSAERLVIAVGFSPGGSIAASPAFAAKCIWSIHRPNLSFTHATP